MQDAKRIVQQLNTIYFNHKINFDLDDCDKILRIEGKNIEPQHIIKQLLVEGFECEQLF